MTSRTISTHFHAVDSVIMFAENVQVVKSAKTKEAPIAKQKRRQGIGEKKNTALAPFVDVPAILAPSAIQASKKNNKLHFFSYWRFV
jgi:hypothetical protein